ncbi:methyl-accepting chemotaxis protein [Stutzerimonas azotifigens]|uniref:Methyl-accepting chemotaxis protein n=1 Tax=Stutzerimonas azotifigens TaxID=291995 RepID=A0ABR5Z4T7_9GAMM|nr:PAS domain-containing methyl-accepting chemotaxis protein [Stutzerimonas azotifigens]MBA1275249.1 methyl-accepting chemotaxis protein [Stutzerimonas azotifigens]
MRNNQPVSQREYAFPEQQRLISTTDLKGKITYCNDIFVEVSGFAREELIGSPHNLVRHPDVPPAVFQHMWTCLKDGKPWMGIVKNRRKNGDHYWVSAYVTPMLDNNRQVVGYESVRTKPSAAQISRAQALYARINAGKGAVPTSDLWLPVVAKWLPFILISQIGFLIGTWQDHYWGFLLAALLSIPLGLAGLHWQQAGINRLLRLTKAANTDPLIAKMFTTSRGVEARLEMAIISQEAHLKTCLTRLQDSAEQLQNQAQQAEGLAQNCSSGLSRQRQETEQMAAAITQMAATTQEVAGNVAQTAEATQQASRLTAQGQNISGETRKAIERLSDSVSETRDAVTKLARDSDQIGSVVDVIRGIAEQTNLLALNAAIEAARAGDSGRGFAVVADEVRQLAKRTADATGQIHELIATLQHQAKTAVGTTESGRAHADHGVEQVRLADQALSGISQAMDNIANMASQIAAAAEEQSAVADEISQNVTTIAQLADQTSGEAQNTALLSKDLSHTADLQFSLVERFNR